MKTDPPSPGNRPARANRAPWPPDPALLENLVGAPGAAPASAPAPSPIATPTPAFLKSQVASKSPVDTPPSVDLTPEKLEKLGLPPAAPTGVSDLSPMHQTSNHPSDASPLPTRRSITGIEPGSGSNGHSGSEHDSSSQLESNAALGSDLKFDFGSAPAARRRLGIPPWKLALISTLGLVAVIWFIGRLTSGTETTNNNAKSVTASGSSGSVTAKPASNSTGPAKDDSETGNSKSGSVPFTSSPNYPAALSIAGMEENNTRAEALEALMETWVAADPVQAGNWAGSLPAGTFRDDALSSLMFHWSGKDPAAAAAWMSRTGVDDPEAVSVLSSRWAAQSPAAAAAWASTLSNLESRRGALSSIAGAWAATDPVSASAWAASLSGEERTAAIVTSITAWAAISPASASQWLSSISFSSENDRAAAAAALVTAWTAHSPAAVSKFINTLPEGPAREAAASQFAVTAAPNAPAEALMWAMNLTDPAQRNQVVADTCESWLDGSPESFKAGIAEAMTLMEDPAMRRGVFEMLYERDPAFQTSLIKMVDDATIPKPPEPVPATSPSPTQTQAPSDPAAALAPASSPLPPPDASLLPPPNSPVTPADSNDPAAPEAPAEPGPDDINL